MIEREELAETVHRRGLARSIVFSGQERPNPANSTLEMHPLPSGFLATPGTRNFLRRPDTSRSIPSPILQEDTIESLCQ